MLFDRDGQRPIYMDVGRTRDSGVRGQTPSRDGDFLLMFLSRTRERGDVLNLAGALIVVMRHRAFYMGVIRPWRRPQAAR